MTDKPYSEMTTAELQDELRKWCAHVETATGFASAHFAAKQVEACVKSLARLGVVAHNPYPITTGASL